MSMRLSIFTFVCLLAAGLGLAADRASIPSVLEEDIGRFRQRMASASPECRLEGVQGAFYLRLWDFEEDLLRLLRDPDPRVKLEAVKALGRCGTGRSAPELIALLSDSDWAVREHAHLALREMTAGKRGRSSFSEKELRPLFSFSELFEDLGDKEAEVRQAAARALRCMATPAEEDRILQRLTEGPLDGKARAALTEALDRIGTEKSLPYLLKRASEGDAAAAWAVARRGGPEAEDALVKGFARNGSLEFMLSLDRVKTTKCGPFVPRLCQQFASVIRAGRGEEIRYPPSPVRRVASNLIRRSDRADELVDLILREMEGKGDDAAIPVDLKPLFDSLRQLLRPEFVREGLSGLDCLLGAFHDVADDPSIAPRLIPLLRSPVLLVRIYAALTLGKLRVTEAAGPILAVIHEGYSFPDSTSAVSGKHTVEFRVEDGKRQRQSHTVRWLGYYCVALGHIGADDCRQALETLAANPDLPRDVRYGSVVGLGWIGSPASLPALKQVAEGDLIWLIRDTAKRAAADIEIARKNGGLKIEN